MYTFIAKDNHESKKLKDISTNIVNDELKNENYKNVLLNRSYMRMKWIELKARIII